MQCRARLFASTGNRVLQPHGAAINRASRSLPTDRCTSSGPRASMPGSKHGTDLYLSVSNDRGQSFASEVKINDDKVPGPHGMHSLAVAKTDESMSAGSTSETFTLPNPRQRAKAITWRAIAIFISLTRQTAAALSHANRKVASEACPCCKTALAVSRGWNVVCRLASGFAGKFPSHCSCRAQLTAERIFRLR